MVYKCGFVDVYVMYTVEYCSVLSKGKSKKKGYNDNQFFGAYIIPSSYAVPGFFHLYMGLNGMFIMVSMGTVLSHRAVSVFCSVGVNEVEGKKSCFW